MRVLVLGVAAEPGGHRHPGELGQGDSITSADHRCGRRVGIIPDETHKVAVTRLDDRIRVGDTAELTDLSPNLREGCRGTLEHVVTDLFPQAGDVAKGSSWCGVCPMTPDGTPVADGTPIRDLPLATGHGTLGRTLACGTGRVVADRVAGRKPEIDASELGVGRCRRQ